MTNWKIIITKLKNMFSAKRFIEKIWEDEFKISLFVLAVAFLLINIPTVFSGRYFEKDFLESMLSNANSMILDILIILCLTTFLIKKSNKRREMQRYFDEIEDYRGWHSEEASHRIKGLIYRLNKIDITKINLRNCCLQMADLSGVNLSGAELEKANLVGANLDGAKFVGARLWYSNLQGASLLGTNFENAQLIDANLQKVFLVNANLNRANLRGANFKDAKLTMTDLKHTVLIDTNFEKADISFAFNILTAEGLSSANFTNAILQDDVRKKLANINKTATMSEDT